MTADTRLPAAWYAAPRTGFAEWWTVLHPPYTLWHLSYVVLGASVAPHLEVTPLLATLLAFTLAVGLGAHALDELHGHPLGTTLTATTLVTVAVVALAGACALGFLGLSRVGPGLLGFIVAGVVLVVGYNLELLGGALHNAAGFAAGWGAFPALTAYFAQTGRVSPAPLLIAMAAFGLSLVQRTLSARARRLRRHTIRVGGSMRLQDGSEERIDRDTLLRPLETSLRLLSWTMVILAAGVAVSRAP